jgi:small membrane protein
MSMTLVQAILLVLIAGLVIYSVHGRNVSRDRVVLLALAVLGAVLVLWPGLSTDVARAVGGGGGTDPLFYLFVLFCLFRFVSIAGDKRRLEQRLTAVVRELALMSARPGPGDERKPPGEVVEEQCPPTA